jgi:hypothetical protein
MKTWKQSTIIGIVAIIAIVYALSACGNGDGDTTTPTITRINAVYTQGGTTIYPTTPLNNLKTGLTITAHYSDSTSKTITDYTLNGTLNIGTSTVTVTYEGKNDTFTVTVSDPNTTPPTVTSISAVYTQGGTAIYTTTPLDDLKAGLTVTAHYNNGTSQTVTAYTLSGTLTVGSSTVTVTYQGINTTFTVTVSGGIAPTVASISAVYTQGETTVYTTTPLNDLKANLTVTAHYSNGTSQTVTAYTLGGTLTVGSSTVTVTYQGHNTNFTVNVTYPTVQNVEFPQTSSVNNFTDAKILALTQLAEQSDALNQCQFEWNSNYLQSIWNSTQIAIGSDCRNNTDVVSIRDNISSNLGGLVVKIGCELIDGEDESAANLFINQADAFRAAHALQQRKLSNVVSQDAEETALMAQLGQLGITATNIPEAITQLRQALETSMPQECSEYATDITQQWEDCAQFDGWVEDLTKLGISSYVPPRTQQTRAAMQRAAGLQL